MQQSKKMLNVCQGTFIFWLFANGYQGVKLGGYGSVQTYAGEQDRHPCLFCGDPLEDDGAAFLEHIGQKEGCHSAYEAWLERLDEDRPGG